MTVCIINYVAIRYWQLARAITSTAHIAHQLSAWELEEAMDRCTELRHLDAPDWLQNHAKRFSDAMNAKFALAYEDLLNRQAHG